MLSYQCRLIGQVYVQAHVGPEFFAPHEISLAWFLALPSTQNRNQKLLQAPKKAYAQGHVRRAILFEFAVV